MVIFFYIYQLTFFGEDELPSPTLLVLLWIHGFLLLLRVTAIIDSQMYYYYYYDYLVCYNHCLYSS